MAMKDWKKVGEKRGGIWFENKKTYQRLVLVKTLGENKYIITSGGEILGTFKTKSEALAYAKSYMRTH